MAAFHTKVILMSYTQFSITPPNGGKLAIIIDDFGSSRDGVKEMMGIKENNLYFVDSLTSRSPASRKLSGIYNIRCYERNIFLDGNRSVGYVNKQLEKAQRYALKNGTAVAIGHVGMEGGKTTATAILEMLPDFKKNNIELVFINSSLIFLRSSSSTAH